MTDRLKVEYISPSKLTPYDGNPRIHTEAQIQKLAQHSGIRSSVACFG